MPAARAAAEPRERFLHLLLALPRLRVFRGERLRPVEARFRFLEIPTACSSERGSASAPACCCPLAELHEQLRKLRLHLLDARRDLGVLRLEPLRFLDMIER